MWTYTYNCQNYIVNILNPEKENYKQPVEINQWDAVRAKYIRAWPLWSFVNFKWYRLLDSFKAYVKCLFYEQLFYGGTKIMESKYWYSVSYMCASFSKAEDKTSEAMRQAAKEAYVSGKLNFKKMEAISIRFYMTKQECSVKEPV